MLSTRFSGNHECESFQIVQLLNCKSRRSWLLNSVLRSSIKTKAPQFGKVIPQSKQALSWLTSCKDTLHLLQSLLMENRRLSDSYVHAHPPRLSYVVKFGTLVLFTGLIDHLQLTQSSTTSSSPDEAGRPCDTSRYIVKCSTTSICSLVIYGAATFATLIHCITLSPHISPFFHHVRGEDLQR